MPASTCCRPGSTRASRRADMSALVQEQAFAEPRRTERRRHRLLHAGLRNPSFLVGLLILLTVIGVALCASLLFPGDPQDMAGLPTLWPGEDAAFPLGTDSLGRDVAS